MTTPKVTMSDTLELYYHDKLIMKGNLIQVSDEIGLGIDRVRQIANDGRITRKGYQIVIVGRNKDIKKYCEDVERRLLFYGNTCFTKHKKEVLEHLDSKGIKYKIKWYEFPVDENIIQKKGKDGNWLIELYERK